MKRNCIVFVLIFFQWIIARADETNTVQNIWYTISWTKGNTPGFIYQPKGSMLKIPVSFPTFELNGSLVPTLAKNFHIINISRSTNGRILYELIGSLVQLSDCSLKMSIYVAENNPVVRFAFELKTTKDIYLTKSNRADNLTYTSFPFYSSDVKEIRLSAFNEKDYAYHRTEQIWDHQFIETGGSFMGPLAVFNASGYQFLIAYEHGSSYPDAFIQFKGTKNHKMVLKAVKGNYYNGQQANGFHTVWFEIAAVKGNELFLANQYRQFILHDLSENKETRRPYIYYNTWARQERAKWKGDTYLSTMNLKWTLIDIDKAHILGVDVYVVDMGWFNKTGDWKVNSNLFPDGLKEVKKKLDAYHMKLGLWFNPTVAAVSSQCYASNLNNRISWNGIYQTPHDIWGTEKSVGMCVVSSYWENFAQRLIELNKELGVTYFKWDAISQYECNDAHHFHGGIENDVQERSENYAFLQPLYLCKIVQMVCKKVPDAIFDFDITEGERCVGLAFLSVGKYYIMNNGPYFHTFNLTEQWKTILDNGNVNIFVHPGPARGWFMRSILDYEPWIPSILLTSHYMTDEPKTSQTINIASLILGQNGLWGELLNVSDSGVAWIHLILEKYKKVSEDITEASLIHIGSPGDSPEIYEKINHKTGRGCVAIFANQKGVYDFTTSFKTDSAYWKTTNMKIRFEKGGKAYIKASFPEQGAELIFFGVK